MKLFILTNGVVPATGGHCDSRSAGTAILFSDKFQPTISQIVCDDNGRYIIVIIESVDNIPYVLCNLYAIRRHA